MQTTSVTEIRSLGVTKVNQLVRAHRRLEELRPGFAEWQAGEIYVCKKTGSYRYRFGEKSKSPTAWSKIAEELFDSPAAFALAALILGPAHSEPAEKPEAKPAPKVETRPRANIIALANAA